MSSEFVIKVKQYAPVADRRLGRHVVHDSRSLNYQVRAVPDPRRLASVRHEVHIPILDQGDLGSCTGNAGAAAMASGGFWPAVQAVMPTDALQAERWAVALYSDATKIDPWPEQYEPEDTGSDGLSIAKVLKNRGVISGYKHATSRDAALTALAEGVVMIGSDWLEGMYDVTADGHMSVKGNPLGGHEYALDELDVARQRVWMRNSWSEGWGLKGRAWMSWDEFDSLLDQNGDCTVLVPRDQVAPQPVPVTPAKDVIEQSLANALEKVMDNHTVPKYLRIAGANWLKDKGYL